VTRTAKAIATGVRKEGEIARPKAAYSNTVTADPQVPGPGRSRPIPKNVATKVAHNGVRRDAPGTCPELAEATAGEAPALLSGFDVSFTILLSDLRGCFLESTRPHL